jgi:hypothetical protein
MQKLIQNKVPPGGWWCEWHGLTIHGGAKTELMDRCIAHNVSQGIPIPLDIEWQVEDAICKRMPPNSRDCSLRGAARIQIDASMVKRFLLSLLAWFAKGFQFVPQEEADRRASICVECPLQADAPGCWGCKGIGWLVNKIKGDRTTPYDVRLKSCSVCGCYNPVQVHVPLDVLQGVSGDLEYPGHCWKKNVESIHPESKP